MTTGTSIQIVHTDSPIARHDGTLGARVGRAAPQHNIINPIMIVGPAAVSELPPTTMSTVVESWSRLLQPIIIRFEYCRASETAGPGSVPHENYCVGGGR